jgi:hypothetical protein
MSKPLKQPKSLKQADIDEIREYITTQNDNIIKNLYKKYPKWKKHSLDVLAEGIIRRPGTPLELIKSDPTGKSRKNRKRIKSIKGKSRKSKRSKRRKRTKRRSTK